MGTAEPCPNASRRRCGNHNRGKPGRDPGVRPWDEGETIPTKKPRRTTIRTSGAAIAKIPLPFMSRDQGNLTDRPVPSQHDIFEIGVSF